MVKVHFWISGDCFQRLKMLSGFPEGYFERLIGISGFPEKKIVRYFA
jgi:hypothetical protein